MVLRDILYYILTEGRLLSLKGDLNTINSFCAILTGTMFKRSGNDHAETEQMNSHEREWFSVKSAVFWKIVEVMLKKSMNFLVWNGYS